MPEGNETGKKRKPFRITAQAWRLAGFWASVALVAALMLASGARP